MINDQDRNQRIILSSNGINFINKNNEENQFNQSNCESFNNESSNKSSSFEKFKLNELEKEQAIGKIIKIQDGINLYNDKVKNNRFKR